MAVLKLPLVVLREIPEIVFESDKKLIQNMWHHQNTAEFLKKILQTGKLIVRFTDDESNR